MNLITKLDLHGVEGVRISDITGLEVFKNLEELSLYNNSITDITPITGLTKLQSINLSENKGINIYKDGECYLPNKENIVELNISGTNNSDIGFVSELPNLKIFKAANNGISSTEELKSLSNIEILDLSSNRAITKIDDILSLFSLKNLDISTTGIKSLLHSKSEEGDDEYGIFVLENLEELYVADNSLKSINPVIKTYMEKIDVLGVELEIELPYLNKLKILNFNNTGQSEIDYDRLILLQNLTHLYMRGNGITNVSDVITKLAKLEYINLSYNEISDIDWIRRIEDIGLEDILVYDEENGNHTLKTYPNVIYFDDEHGNRKKKIILSATKIELAHNKITDINSLDYINHDIKYLNLAENAIYDIGIIESGRFSFSEGLNLKKQGTGWEEPIYYMPIKDKGVKVDQYIILPDLFQNSKRIGSRIYSDEANFTVNNIELNNNEEYQVPGYYNVIIGHEKTESDKLSVTLHCGCRYGTTIHDIGEGCADGSVLHFKVINSEMSIDSAVFNDPNLISAVTSEIAAMGEYAKCALKIMNVYSYVFDKIDTLHLEGKDISDITGLASFGNLKYLYLSDNKISSIDDLKENSVMLELYLSNNSNLKDNNSPVENMVNLNELDLSNTGLTNLDVIKKLIQNMKKNNEGTYPLKYLNLSENSLGTIDGVEQIGTLEELYIADIDIKDISKLSKLTNLEVLNASGNRIESLEYLRGLKKLRNLNISKNHIEDIEPISEIPLDYLDFSINRVKDVTSLSKSYTSLIMDSNFINNINIFEGMRIQNFSVENQKLTHTVEQGETGDITIELPALLKLSQKSGSKVYTDKEFILTTNCTLTEDKKSVIVNVEELKDQIAIVKIDGGNADKTTFSIAEPLEGTIKYEPSNEIPTNQDITASITFNRENVTITNNDGKDTYVFTENGEFTFKYMDENGFEGETKAIVTNIDKTPPEGNITQEIVNKDVIVKIDLSEPIEAIEGWIAAEDGLSITKTYSVSSDEIITLKDNVGNTSSVQVIVEIDTTPPTITGVEEGKIYCTSVTPLIEDKNLDTIKLLKNDVEVEGYLSGTPIIESGKYILTVTDKFQNETKVTFEIDVSGVIISTTDKVVITEEEILQEETKPVIKVLTAKLEGAKIREMISSEMPFEILNSQDEGISDDNYIGTGYKIKMEGGKIYTIIVAGDLNGNGEISLNEVVQAAKVAVGITTQSEELKFKAMDITGNGKINVSDVAAIAKLKIQ